jgi:hypothetical protein
MKGMIGVALAFALALCAAPAMAGDTFQAFRTLPAAERARLTPLADDQLAAVEGAWGMSRPINYPVDFALPVNINFTLDIVIQLNVCAVCTGVEQSNLAVISHAISF